MLLADLVAASDAVAATSSRTAKIVAFAEVRRGLHPDEIAAAVGFLTGQPRQGKIGIGWATLAGIARDPAVDPSIEILDLDAAVGQILATRGSGAASPPRGRRRGA